MSLVTRKNPSLRSRRASKPFADMGRAVIDTLESRQFLSVAAPAGYVKIGSMSVASVNAAKNGPEASTSQQTLKSGVSYFLKVSGTYTCATNRQADAGYHQRYGAPSNWDANGSGLVAGGIGSWGAYDAQHEYGGYTTGGGAKLSAQINDSKYDDNGGSLKIDIYEKLPTVSISGGGGTVNEKDEPTIAYTVSRDGSTAQSLAVSLNWGGDTRSGVDYASVPSSVTIPSGQGSFTFYVNVLDDGAPEPDETLTVQVLPANNRYSVASPAPITTTFAANDLISDSEANEGHNLIMDELSDDPDVVTNPSERKSDLRDIAANCLGKVLSDLVGDMGKDIISAALTAANSLAKSSLKPIIDAAQKKLREIGKEAIRDDLSRIRDDIAICVTACDITINGKTVKGTVTTIVERATGRAITIVEGTVTDSDGTRRRKAQIESDLSRNPASNGKTIAVDVHGSLSDIP